MIPMWRVHLDLPQGCQSLLACHALLILPADAPPALLLLWGTHICATCQVEAALLWVTATLRQLAL